MRSIDRIQYDMFKELPLYQPQMNARINGIENSLHFDYSSSAVSTDSIQKMKSDKGQDTDEYLNVGKNIRKFI